MKKTTCSPTNLPLTITQKLVNPSFISLEFGTLDMVVELGAPHLDNEFLFHACLLVLLWHDEFSSTIAAVQFAYVVQFTFAFPWAPVMALLNNIFEIRIDANKLLKQAQRPPALGAENIGLFSPLCPCMCSRYSQMIPCSCHVWTPPE